MSSHEELPYSQVAIIAWTALSAIVSFLIFLSFVFGPHLLNQGNWIWDMLRYFARPII